MTPMRCPSEVAKALHGVNFRISSRWDSKQHIPQDRQGKLAHPDEIVQGTSQGASFIPDGIANGPDGIVNDTSHPDEIVKDTSHGAGNGFVCRISMSSEEFAGGGPPKAGGKQENFRLVFDENWEDNTSKRKITPSIKLGLTGLYGSKYNNMKYRQKIDRLHVDVDDLRDVASGS